MAVNEVQKDPIPLENRPGIFMIGSSSVGKRTLLSRLLSIDFDEASDSSSEVVVHGWTINTKYYTADVSVWMAHLDDAFSIGSLPIFNQLAALVLVFDMSDLSSLVALQKWVSQTDIQNFEILLCIGNKVDLVPGHPVHAEYRRRLQKIENSFTDPCLEFTEYGISEFEGTSLLAEEEEPSREIRRSCLEWCTEYNIEFIEACSSNAEFDRCLSVDGDSQGVERVYDALSAHMWPGMILKSGDRITDPSLPEKEELSSEESDYELEYEILSAGSADAWDDTENGWVSATALDAGGSVSENNPVSQCKRDNGNEPDKEMQASTSTAALEDAIDKAVVDSEELGDPGEGKHIDLEDLEQMMSEIGNMRASLRLMPDFQRREMAAKLAMKMAAMFGGSSDDEEKVY
ncbi:GTP-binding protein [Quillaja saponaria]|uniref:GTP-binding protein n=1 Tax=Quillaja saponaria TaxID=32244 RepID=A0AAD7L9K6_QUISA|nr:GTP-binding protein [Quillaja saponaria]